MTTKTRQQHRKYHAGLGYEQHPRDQKKPLSKKEVKMLLAEMAEAAARAEQIKADWTAEETERRLVGCNGYIPWSLPEYCAEYVSAQPGTTRYKEKRVKVYKALK